MQRRTRVLMETLAAATGRVRHLIVVLEKGDELCGFEPGRGRPPARLLPHVPLPLKEEPPLGERDELLRSAAVIRVIGLASSGDRDGSGVVEVVVPQRIEAKPAVLNRTECPDVLPL